MKQLNFILKKLFCLSPIPTILISVPSFAFVIYVLVADIENSIISYFAYILSAYSLTITITGIYRLVSTIRQDFNHTLLMRKVISYPLGERFLNDVLFRAEVSLYLGLFINLLYAVIKLFSGVYYRSWWFITLAVYYIFLAIMRFLLLIHVNQNTDQQNMISEFRRYRCCGIILFFMNIALAGMVILVVHQNFGFKYPGTLIYAMAAYVFYTIVTAVINVIKFKKHGSPIMSASKIIKLTTALVSIFSLETAMLAQFGSSDEPIFRQIMTAATGISVCLIVLSMSVFMIFQSTKQLKKMRFNNSQT